MTDTDKLPDWVFNNDKMDFPDSPDDPDPLRWLRPEDRAIAEAKIARLKALIEQHAQRRAWAQATRAWLRDRSGGTSPIV
jgi:hypothetical protein